MNLKEARQFAKQLCALVGEGRLEEAGTLLEPLLSRRIPFAVLDRIGETLAKSPDRERNAFLDGIAAGRSMGGWVVIASALGQQLDDDLAGALSRCREFVALAGVWFAADIFGERVPGPALVAHFASSLPLLEAWRSDADPWIRRAAGVAVHFWAKRSRGAPELKVQALRLLDFLDPMFSERETEAVKGVGWGLKTLGKHYPDLLISWLPERIGRPHRKLMLRKALTYLPQDVRQTFLKERES